MSIVDYFKRACGPARRVLGWALSDRLRATEIP